MFWQERFPLPPEGQRLVEAGMFVRHPDGSVRILLVGAPRNGLFYLAGETCRDGFACAMGYECAVLRDQSPRPAPLRLRMPYGEWTDTAGRQFLFNRDYEPIWTRLRGGAAAPCSPAKWVEARDSKTRWFYGMGAGDRRFLANPWNSARVRRRCEEVLREWGIDPNPPERYTGLAIATMLMTPKRIEMPVTVREHADAEQWMP